MPATVTIKKNISGKEMAVLVIKTSITLISIIEIDVQTAKAVAVGISFRAKEKK